MILFHSVPPAYDSAFEFSSAVSFFVLLQLLNFFLQFHYALIIIQHKTSFLTNSWRILEMFLPSDDAIFFEDSLVILFSHKKWNCSTSLRPKNVCVYIFLSKSHDLNYLSVIKQYRCIPSKFFLSVLLLFTSW